MTLRGDIETQTDGWLALANKCLQLIEARSDCVNVIVTQTQVGSGPVQQHAMHHCFYASARGCSHQDPPVRPGTPLPRRECLLCDKNWQRRLFRENYAKVWQKVNLCCSW